MKKISTSLASIAMGALVLGMSAPQAFAQTDVTKYFLENYGFDSNFDYPASSTAAVSQEIKEIPGWTQNFSMDYTIAGVYEFGFQGTFNKAVVPAKGYDNEAGGALCLSTGWGNAMAYTQEVTLPAGKYTLKAPCFSGKDATDGTSALSWLPDNGSAVASATASYPYNQWTLDQVSFTLDKATAGKIQIGYVAGAGGSVNSVNLAIDYVALLVQDMDKSTLKAAIDEALEQYGDGSGNGAAALKTAIDAAQKVYNDSKADAVAVLEAEIALRAAIKAYREQNVSEENPLDVTDRYLVNPSFEEGAKGWSTSELKAQTNSDFPVKAGSTYYEKWVSAGKAVGNAYAKQTVTLPAGKYFLTVGGQNLNQNDKSAKCEGAVVFAGSNEEPIYTPADYTVKFISLGAPIVLGFNAADATGNWLAIDNFRLFTTGDVDPAEMVAAVQALVEKAEALQGKMMNSAAATALANAIAAGKAITTSSSTEAAAAAIAALQEAIAAAEASIAEYAALQEAIDAAEAVYDASKQGAADFKDAIDTAKQLVADPNATSEELAAEIEALATATLAFNMANSTGDTPVVTGNPYIARGCRIAFGRMEVESGVKVIETGFCYSETSKNPTVLDGRSSAYFEHAGKIYYMKDIKPATTYYVRPYAISDGYKVGYGTAIKIVTLPEATCTWSWNRNDCTDEEDARCQAAIAESMENYNYCSAFKGFHLTGNYQAGAGAGDGTADCSYGGWMRISQNAAYQRTGTVQHETNHGVGIGTTDRWYNNANLRANTSRGHWLGRRANELVNFFENKEPGTIIVTGDQTHMWAVTADGSTASLLNYGINGAQEDSGSKLLYYANAMLTEFLCEDGINPTKDYYNGVPCYTFTHDDNERYYLLSENAQCGLNTAGFLRENTDGTLSWKSVNALDEQCAWYIEYNAETGHYSLRNAATGKYVRIARGGAVTSDTNTSIFEQLQFMPGRTDLTIGTGDDAMTTYGYWMTITNTAGATYALGAQAAEDGASEGLVDTIKHDFSNDGGSAQRWIIMNHDQIEAYKAATGLTDLNGIAAPSVETVRTVEGIYSIDGISLPRTRTGVNIIRYSDGTSEKIIL